MMYDKAIKYLIMAMVVFSVISYWGAYAAVTAAFIVMLIHKPKELSALVRKQKPIIFLAAALALATIFSKVLGKSLLIDAVLILHFIAFAVLVTETKPDDLEKLYKLLNILAIFISIFGIYQYVTGDLYISESWTDSNNFGSLVRIYSTLRNPNIFAGYLAFNISYAWAYVIQKKKDIPSMVNIILSSICLILTYSRGGFIALFAAMLMIIVLYKEWRAGVYLLVMTMLYYGYNTIGGLNRADLSIINTDSSSLYRMEIWKASFKLFLNDIAFGSGPGSVMQYLSFSSDKLKGLIYHSHNIYIHLLAETGIAGLCAFGYLVFNAFKKFISFWKESRYSQYAFIAAGFAASMTALLVHGLIDCVAFIPTRSLIFLIYLSLFPILIYNLRKAAD